MTLIYLTIWSQTMYSWNLLQTSLLLQWMAKCLNWWTSHNSLQNSFIVNCIVFQTKEILGFWKLCHRLLKFHLDFQSPHRPSEDCYFHIILQWMHWFIHTVNWTHTGWINSHRINTQRVYWLIKGNYATACVKLQVRTMLPDDCL